jgi:uncharacterized protein (DUF58 family)
MPPSAINTQPIPGIAPAAQPAPRAHAQQSERPVRWRLSRHARRLLTLGLAAAFAATIARRPEFAGVAAPALLLLGAGHGARPATVDVRVKPSTTRAFEGEIVYLDATLTGDTAGLDVRWTVEAGKGVEQVGTASADGTQVRLLLRPEHWGRRQLGRLKIVLRDRWRLTEGYVDVELPRLDCYPHPAEQNTTVVLSRLPNWLGEHTARAPGEGTEFSGVRDYAPGDRQRSINWAATTRRGRLQVNTFSAERSQDVVLLTDATSDIGEPGSSALDLALRGASAAARAYLEGRDRVGVITYQWGGADWLAPGLGKRQVYKIIDTMLTSDSGWSRGASFRRLPRAALPPGSLVIVFSPLLDQRFIEALRDMRERGFTMLIIDVLNVEPPVRPRVTDRLARRIWKMEQEANRFSLRELGIPVVRWNGTDPLDLPLAPYTHRPLMHAGTRR